MRSYIICSICGSGAITMNMKTCTSIKRTGKICGGTISRVKGLLVLSDHDDGGRKGTTFKNHTFQGLWRMKEKS